MRDERELAEAIDRALRLLVGPITAPSGVTFLELIVDANGIPASKAEFVRRALTETIASSQDESVRMTLGGLLARFDVLCERGVNLAARRRIATARSWLDRTFPSGAPWSAVDAEDVVTYLDRVNATRVKEHQSPLASTALRREADGLLRQPRYINHCWNCKTDINSRLDERCRECRRYYRCRRCGACFHNAPDAPSAAELRGLRR